MSVRGSLRRACAWMLTTAVVAAGLVLGQAPPAGADASDLPVCCTEPGPPRIDVADVTEIEDGFEAGFRVTLSKASTETITFDFAQVDGEAVAGPDYVTRAGTATFAPGETETWAAWVSLVDDGIDEDTETFRLVLSNATGDAEIGDGDATATIIDDDGPEPTVTVEDAVANERDGVIVFRYTLSEAYHESVGVGGYVVGGTASSDEHSWTENQPVPPGALEGEYRIGLRDDRTDEPDETIEVQFIPWNAVLPDPYATGTIHDDDDPVSIGIGVPRANEADGYAEFAFLVSHESEHPITFHYATVDGSAVAGQDYVATSGTVTIPAGAPHAGVRVPVIDDADDEPDVETFTLALTDVSGAEMPASTGEGWIYDDDEPVVPDVSVAPSEAYEDDGEIAFTITLSEPTTVPVEVTYSTGDSTSSNGARHARDFRFTAGTVQLAPGATTAVISVPLIDDLVPELDEGFRFLLQSATGGTIVTPRVNGTIHDDDPVRLGSVL